MPEPATTATNDDLLPAISAGDAAAFARWLAGAEDRLRGSLRSFAERVDVEAVLQEALVRVWQVAPRVVPDGRPHALLRLAIRIARNIAVSDPLAAHLHRAHALVPPLMTRPRPIGNSSGCPQSCEESNFVPLLSQPV